MKKILMLIFVFTIFTFVGKIAYAETSTYDVAVQMVESTNSKIDDLIKQAQVDADNISYPVGTVEYNYQLDIIINNLITETNKIANQTIKVTGNLGVTVICEYETYLIGDRYVEIDPLRVHDW